MSISGDAALEGVSDDSLTRIGDRRRRPQMSQFPFYNLIATRFVCRRLRQVLSQFPSSCILSWGIPQTESFSDFITEYLLRNNSEEIKKIGAGSNDAQWVQMI